MSKKPKITKHDLRRAKQGLCQIITGCDGPLLLPCGDKTDDPKACEEWKEVTLRKKDITSISEKGNPNIAKETFERVQKEFLERVGS